MEVPAKDETHEQWEDYDKHGTGLRSKPLATVVKATSFFLNTQASFFRT